LLSREPLDFFGVVRSIGKDQGIGGNFGAEDGGFGHQGAELLKLADAVGRSRLSEVDEELFASQAVQEHNQFASILAFEGAGVLAAYDVCINWGSHEWHAVFSRERHTSFVKMILLWVTVLSC